MTKANYNKKKFQDLKETIELRNAEIDELNMQLATKDKEINKFKNYITKQKYELKTLELKVDGEINNEKAKIKELDNLQQKLKEKQDIIDDKQNQIKYLRTLIDDYKLQIHNNTENLEIQLRKISKTYDGLLAQKDLIIEKQDENIKSLLKDKEEIIKSNKTNVISLKLQNDKYRELIKKYEEKLD